MLKNINYIADSSLSSFFAKRDGGTTIRIMS